MHVGILKVTLNFQDCHSLKEKRQVLRSLMQKLKNIFNIAISETHNQDLWQLGEIGIVTVNSSAKFCREILDQVMEHIVQKQGDFQVISHDIENLKF